MDTLENVYIFVADAMRFDYLSPEVAQLGAKRLSFASSTVSPTSFASILSGLHPPNHGVWTFGHTLPDGTNQVLQTEGYNGSFWQRNPKGEVGQQAIFNVLGHDKHSEQLPVSDVEPPFIAVERDATTHSPYGRFGSEDNIPEHTDFINEHHSRGNLKNIYNHAASETANIFKSRLKTLEQRELLNDTLVIFTSDHGELLGECGLFDHGTPVVPELLRVPTVFIHPDEMEPKSTHLSHVDIIPTALDILGKPIPNFLDGHSVYSEHNRDGNYYSKFKKPENYTFLGRDDSKWAKYSYEVSAVLDSNGGWFFTKSPIKSRLKANISAIAPTLRYSLPKVHQSLPHFLQSSRQIGDPRMTEADALKQIDIIETQGDTKAQKSELSQEQKNHLRDLGYR